MFRFLCSCILACACILSARAQTLTIPGPAGSTQFGDGIIVLANGNYVIRDAYWNNGSVLRVGAVYLYDGRSHALISRLTGSTAQDQVGSGIIPLANGNFVVMSPEWDGAAVNTGAVTWVNGTTGLSGTVSAANSLTGSSANDAVGTVTPLSNGNYVVSSPAWDGTAANVGAVTWANGATGIVGPVSQTNSLVGSTAGDQVGQQGIVPLPNGSYVVRSSGWSGSAPSAGAVTWGSAAGISGIVSAANSLTGSATNDQVGSLSITVLANGSYVVRSPGWNGTRGAASWGSGTAGVSGVVSAANSLVGTVPSDRVGLSVTALSNGNYVVSSSLNGTGAATWGNGGTGVRGTVSVANSLTGSSTNDNVGSSVVALKNGNYVVVSSLWNGTANGAGAVTWGDGAAGISGTVSPANSLVGGSAGDNVGAPGVYPLANGNYVVASRYWDGSAENVGAVTWGSGTAGVKGNVSIANSLVGTTAQDQVGSVGITPLTNGNYVVTSPSWDGLAVNTGAVTWGSGTTGISGYVTGSNSLTGDEANDNIGSVGVAALTNGNYVVASPGWQDAGLFVGAATWGDGTTGISGIVSPANSLTGSSMGDYVGNYGVMALDNGNYVVRSPFWKGSDISNGAVTWGNGATGISGPVSAANSLVGSKAYDLVGYAFANVYPNGVYAVKHQRWDGSAVDGGAISVGTGAVPLTGPVSSCNSLIGTQTDAVNTSLTVYNPVHEYLLAGMYRENKVMIFTPGSQTLAAATAAASLRIAGKGKVHLLADPCQLIHTVFQSGSSPLSGTINSKVYIEPTAPTAGGARYVRRHYDVQPATAPGTATGTLILYFTQEDFDDYNAANGSGHDLPTGPHDAGGIAALRISQQKGGSATGAPGSYSGAVVSINPPDSHIVWNSSVSRWEVRLEVEGFGGFFVLDAIAAGAGRIASGNTAEVTPIPAGDFFVIATPESGLNATLSDMQGKVVKRFAVSPGARVDVSGLAAGAYLLRMSNGETMKVVRQ